MTTRVLFICPHSAGKSLTAATYFRSAAARAGLDVDIAVAGPDPDEVNMPNVAAALEAQGFTIGWNPKLISSDDTDAADVIVSVGCDHGDIPTDKPISDWDVPMLSEDFAGSMAGIYAKAEAFAAELAGTTE